MRQHCATLTVQQPSLAYIALRVLVLVCCSYVNYRYEYVPVSEDTSIRGIDDV